MEDELWRMSVPAFNSPALILEGDSPATRAQRRIAKKIPNFLRAFIKNLTGSHRACRGPAWGDCRADPFIEVRGCCWHKPRT